MINNIFFSVSRNLYSSSFYQEFHKKEIINKKESNKINNCKLDSKRDI